ncbi:M48 family metalloprotease [Prochlorococcus sp. AH-716-B03]|nr:M48 family metalloprotease [Prochlorococcus sp. AH-716-B03]
MKNPLKKVQKISKELTKYSLFLLILIFLIRYMRNNSTFFMPKEYKTLKNIVNKIASKNYLGDQVIPFSIGSGAYMEYRAEELGLCATDSCYYFKNLNPYKKHSYFKNVNINDLIEQAYLYNSIEAYAWSGVVWLSRSTFRTYGDKIGFLACTVGHEISHIIHNDHIEQSIKLSQKIKEYNPSKGLSKEELKSEEDEYKDYYKKLFSRESEMRADQNSSKMIINSGYPVDTCLKELKFLSKRNHIDAHTDSKSTHPGHLERYKSLNTFIEAYDKSKEFITSKTLKWEWRYDRNSNVLRFIPKN